MAELIYSSWINTSPLTVDLSVFAYTIQLFRSLNNLRVKRSDCRTAEPDAYAVTAKLPITSKSQISDRGSGDIFDPLIFFLSGFFRLTSGGKRDAEVTMPQGFTPKEGFCLFQ